jgi:O-antigen ligase
METNKLTKYCILFGILLAIAEVFLGLKETIICAVLIAYFIFSLKYPEINIVLFFIAGRFQRDIRLDLPLINLNYFLFFTLIASLLVTIIKYRCSRKELITNSLLFTLLLFTSTLLITPLGYGLEKLTRFILVIFIVILFLNIYLTTDKRIKRIFLIYAVVGVLLNLGAFAYSFALSYGSGLTPVGLGPIVFSRLLGMTIFTLIFIFIYYKNLKSVYKVILVLLSLFCFAGMVLAQSRGPILSLIISLLLFLYLYKKTNKKLNYKPLTAIIVLIIIALLVVPMFVNTRLDITDSSKLGTLSKRADYYKSTLKDTFQNPTLIGNGLGSWKYDFNKDAYYPHNIFLEIMYELGIIGLLIFLFLIIKPIHKFYIYFNSKVSNENKLLMLTAFILFIYSLLNSQLSGNFIDNRQIWLFATIVLLIPYLKNETKR